MRVLITIIGVLYGFMVIYATPPLHLQHFPSTNQYNNRYPPFLNHFQLPQPSRPPIITYQTPVNKIPTMRFIDGSERPILKVIQYPNVLVIYGQPEPSGNIPIIFSVPLADQSPSSVSSVSSQLSYQSSWSSFSCRTPVCMEEDPDLTIVFSDDDEKEYVKDENYGKISDISELSDIPENKERKDDNDNNNDDTSSISSSRGQITNLVDRKEKLKTSYEQFNNTKSPGKPLRKQKLKRLAKKETSGHTDDYTTGNFEMKKEKKISHKDRIKERKKETQKKKLQELYQASLKRKEEEEKRKQEMMELKRLELEKLKEQEQEQEQDIEDVEEIKQEMDSTSSDEYSQTTEQGEEPFDSLPEISEHREIVMFNPNNINSNIHKLQDDQQSKAANKENINPQVPKETKDENEKPATFRQEQQKWLPGVQELMLKYNGELQPMSVDLQKEIIDHVEVIEELRGYEEGVNEEFIEDFKTAAVVLICFTPHVNEMYKQLAEKELEVAKFLKNLDERQQVIKAKNSKKRMYIITMGSLTLHLDEKTVRNVVRKEMKPLYVFAEQKLEDYMKLHEKAKLVSDKVLPVIWKHLSPSLTMILDAAENNRLLMNGYMSFINAFYPLL